MSMNLFISIALSPKAGANIERVFWFHNIYLQKYLIFFSTTAHCPILQVVRPNKKMKEMEKSIGQRPKEPIRKKKKEGEKASWLFKEVPN